MEQVNLTTSPSVPSEQRYSSDAQMLIAQLDKAVEHTFEEVKLQPFWHALFSPSTSNQLLSTFLRELFLSIYMYQRHTTEAGFTMLGRLPKCENKLLRSLLMHKAEEAEHGEWALRDYIALGGQESVARSASPSPATFAVASVWLRMSVVENPIGYLGAEHLFEYLTALAAVPVLAECGRRGLSADRIGFIVEHATEDIRHTNLIRHWIGAYVTRHPTAAPSLIRCFEYFRHTYPVPVWTEAYVRAMRNFTQGTLETA
jgi:hypothetical protein